MTQTVQYLLKHSSMLFVDYAGLNGALPGVPVRMITFDTWGTFTNGCVYGILRERCTYSQRSSIRSVHAAELVG